MIRLAGMCLVATLIAGEGAAGEADVVKVDVKQGADGSYRFSVTVRHDDEGWDHYANRWDVVAEDGTVLATRVLAHPHENEQPFTRSLGGVVVPEGTKQVMLRAGDSVHDNGGATITIDLK
jgi:hypothetical protein